MDTVNPTYKKVLRRMYSFFYEQNDIFSKSIQPVKIGLDGSSIYDYIGITYVSLDTKRRVVVLCNAKYAIPHPLTEIAIYKDDHYGFNYIINEYSIKPIDTNDYWSFGPYVSFLQIDKDIKSEYYINLVEVNIYDNPHPPEGTARVTS